jgi:hypothetical protein
MACANSMASACGDGNTLPYDKFNAYVLNGNMFYICTDRGSAECFSSNVEALLTNRGGQCGQSQGAWETFTDESNLDQAGYGYDPSNIGEC